MQKASSMSATKIKIDLWEASADGRTTSPSRDGRSNLPRSTCSQNQRARRSSAGPEKIAVPPLSSSILQRELGRRASAAATRPAASSSVSCSALAALSLRSRSPRRLKIAPDRWHFAHFEPAKLGQDHVGSAPERTSRLRVTDGPCPGNHDRAHSRTRCGRPCWRCIPSWLVRRQPRPAILDTEEGLSVEGDGEFLPFSLYPECVPYVGSDLRRRAADFPPHSFDDVIEVHVVLESIGPHDIIIVRIGKADCDTTRPINAAARPP